MFEHILQYIPKNSHSIINNYLDNKNLIISTVKNRRSTLGNYFPPNTSRVQHKILINKDLEPYQFLITLIHEIAHLNIQEKFKNKVLPHGKEWKQEFKHLMSPCLNQNIFPDDIQQALEIHLKNPKASSNADINLISTLRKYKSQNDDFNILEEIPNKSIFILYEKIFIKGTKINKRILCYNVENKKKYSVFSQANVILIKNENDLKKTIQNKKILWSSILKAKNKFVF